MDRAEFDRSVETLEDQRSRASRKVCKLSPMVFRRTQAKPFATRRTEKVRRSDAERCQQPYRQRASGDDGVATQHRRDLLGKAGNGGAALRALARDKTRERVSAPLTEL